MSTIIASQFSGNKFKFSRRTIKQVLLDQHIITGIGNIYASEILYDARISPFIPANEINIKQIIKLVKSIKKILKKAIASGGTTLRDYVSIDGILGNFQNKFKVYNRENKKILNFKIRRVNQGGRSTFFCPRLQPSKYNPDFFD